MYITKNCSMLALNDADIYNVRNNVKITQDKDSYHTLLEDI